jgi:hypothetical protein
MDIGSIFLILGLLVLVSLFVARPFIERTAIPVSHEEQTYSHLLAERDRILNALQELDFDFALGKIPEVEYPQQRALLLQAGAQVLRELDAYQPVVGGQDVEERIEAAIASRRADMARQAAADPKPIPSASAHNVIAVDDELEVMIAHRRRDRNGKAGGFCPSCGRPVQKADRFCPRCGVTLN